MQGGELMSSRHGMGEVTSLAGSHSRLTQRLCRLLRQAQDIKDRLPESQQGLPQLVLVSRTCMSKSVMSQSDALPHSAQLLDQSLCTAGTYCAMQSIADWETEYKIESSA